MRKKNFVSHHQKIKLAFLLFLLLSNFTFGQKFNGIECGKPLNETSADFVAKGFVKQKFDATNQINYIGEINGVVHEVFLVSTPQTKIVWKFSIWLPPSNNWHSAKSDYFRYKQIFTNKYGTPILDNESFSPPYEEGDGSEMMALKLKKCKFTSFFIDEYGNSLAIELLSLEFNSARMVLSYENKDAVELYTKEKSQIDQNTY